MDKQSKKPVKRFKNYLQVVAFNFVLWGSVAAVAESAAASDEIIGFGRNTTGGKGGQVFRVTNSREFEEASTFDGPAILEIEGVIITNNRDVKSNKTIIGVKAGATLSGCITLLQESSNIIIRNLIITSPSSDDGVTCFAKNVWVDHCTFVDCADGSLDMTKKADFITVSWCKFYYTSKKSHNFANLIADSEGDEGDYNITFHHNWWSTNTTERMPSIRWGNVHVFNNYYNAPDNNYCIRTRINSTVLVENNYFENVKNPWERYVTGGTPGKLKETGNKLVNCVFNAGTDPKVVLIDGKDDVAKPSYPYTLESADDVKARVMAGAGVPFATATFDKTVRQPHASVAIDDMMFDHSSGRISFTATEPDLTKISIFDIKGKEIAEVFNTITQNGQQYEAVFDVSGMAPGAYVGVVKSGKTHDAVKLYFTKK